MRMGGTQSSKLHLENAKDGTCKILFAGHMAINNDTWHFVVGVVDRDVGAKIFIDSNLDAQVNTDTSTYDLSNNRNPMIGFNDVGDYVEPFDGVIDDVRLYNRALSYCEIRSLYEDKDVCGGEGQCTPEELEAAYQRGFNEGLATCQGSGNCQPATLSSDFKMHIPLLHYTPLADDETVMPLWVDMNMADANNLQFKVTDYGVIK